MKDGTGLPDAGVSESRGGRREWAGGARRRRKDGKYRSSDGRLVNTREYAVAWGVINRPYSSKELRRKCAEDPEAPSARWITEKGWNGYPRYYNALVRAGMEPRPPRTDAERRRLLGRATRDGFVNGLLDKDMDVARLAAQYGVASMKDYRRVRRENGGAAGLFPSAESVVHSFGTWRRFMFEVMKYNIDMAITRYVERSAGAGRWLKLSECDAEGIPIRKAMDVLRPALFNQVCYRKLAAMGLDTKAFNKGALEGVR